MLLGLALLVTACAPAPRGYPWGFISPVLDVPAEPASASSEEECTPIVSGTGGPHVIAVICPWMERTSRAYNDAIERCGDRRVELRVGGNRERSEDWLCPTRPPGL